jgi:Tol biopolymer transport system component
MPRLSPNGRWLAYESDESERPEIYVRPFLSTGARVQVSTQGGQEPIWDRSGRTLYYRVGRALSAVAVTTEPTFSLGSERRTVLVGAYLGDPTHANYDVAPDGRHLLMLKSIGPDPKLVLVANWGRELLEKLVGTKK